MKDYIDLGYDIGEVETLTPTSLVPDGDYLVAVVASTIQDSKASGRPALYVSLEIVEGPAAGCVVRDFMSLSKEAAFRFKQFLTAILGRSPEGSRVPRPDWYVGKRVIALIRQGKDNQGVTRSQPIGYRAPSKAPIKSNENKEESEVDFG